ncbi:FAD-binding oxidoreductase [Candidatus Gracilibacteria bacterium]|nr:FAD-binding oxidoreductase [Candidatus Gracilibacteria bacterium]NJM87693.1 FAD-binding oxidoreductase [Hydrococcus sp. RU_2_2]
MTAYDWIVIGAGITGSVLSYELAKKGFRVLLLEKDDRPRNATYYSYGGLAYWSGTTELTRQLAQEGIDIHRHLSEELEADTEFRDIDLVLTIDVNDDPKTVAANYSQFAILPELLSVSEAVELEPLLNPYAISGVLKLPHAHIHAHKTSQAYQQAFCRLGGKIEIEPVLKLLHQGNRLEGVATPQQNYFAANTVVCAGGLSRALLKEAGINVQLYFTHAHLIKTPPVDFCLRSLVMPAIQKRSFLESQATQSVMESQWEEASQNLAGSILDPGAIQFRDRSLYFGQISEIHTSPQSKIAPETSEAQIRQEVGNLLPLLQNLSGTWHSCLVTFAKNSLPLVGEINSFSGVHLFSGFTSTLVFAPPLAKHFASWVAGEPDKIIPQVNNIG